MSEQEVKEEAVTEQEAKEEAETEDRKEEKVVVKEKLMSNGELAEKVVLEYYGTKLLHTRDELARPQDAVVIVPSDKKEEIKGEKVKVIHALSTKEENIDRLKDSLSGDFVLMKHVVRVFDDKIPELIEDFTITLEGLKKAEKFIEDRLKEAEEGD